MFSSTFYRSPVVCVGSDTILASEIRRSSWIKRTVVNAEKEEEIWDFFIYFKGLPDSERMLVATKRSVAERDKYNDAFLEAAGFKSKEKDGS